MTGPNSSPERFDYDGLPPGVEANRARRVAAMVRAVDDAWRDAGRRPLATDASAVAAELLGWEPEQWARLALASGGRSGYTPSPATRAAVVSVYEQRAAEDAVRYAAKSSRK